MPAEWPSPPLSRTENAALPLCSELLSPGPQPFWREEKVAAFSLPLSLRGIALRKLRLQFQQQRRHVSQIALGTSYICRANISGANKKRNLLTFSELGFCFLVFFFLIILRLRFNAHRDLFFTNLCSTFACLLKLSLSSFYAAECKTKEYVQILAPPGRETAAAKDLAEIQKKKKKERETKQNEAQKNTTLSFAWSQIPLFFCSQLCSATPPYRIQPFAFSLLPQLIFF